VLVELRLMEQRHQAVLEVLSSLVAVVHSSHSHPKPDIRLDRRPSVVPAFGHHINTDLGDNRDQP